MIQPTTEITVWVVGESPDDARMEPLFFDSPDSAYDYARDMGFKVFAVDATVDFDSIEEV